MLSFCVNQIQYLRACCVLFSCGATAPTGWQMRSRIRFAHERALVLAPERQGGRGAPASPDSCWLFAFCGGALSVEFLQRRRNLRPPVRLSRCCCCCCWLLLLLPQACLIFFGIAQACGRKSHRHVTLAFAAAAAAAAPQGDLGNDKLIYDARSGRFYEKKLEEVCREEYCAIDETTGELGRERPWEGRLSTKQTTEA